MPEIAIEHYRESHDASTRERSAWNTRENLKEDDAVEALVKELHRKYPRSVRDRRISLE
jgi:pheromone shutdown protein TraB